MDYLIHGFGGWGRVFVVSYLGFVFVNESFWLYDYLELLRNFNDFPFEQK